jgi:hypothetical protein
MPKRKWDKLRDDESIEREKQHRRARLRDRREAQVEMDEALDVWTKKAKR